MRQIRWRAGADKVRFSLRKSRLMLLRGLDFARLPPLEWSPLRQEPEAPTNNATSRLHPAVTTAIAGVQGGTAYSRRHDSAGREEALSSPGGSRNSKSRDC